VVGDGRVRPERGREGTRPSPYRRRAAWCPGTWAHGSLHLTEAVGIGPNAVARRPSGTGTLLSHVSLCVAAGLCPRVGRARAAPRFRRRRGRGNQGGSRTTMHVGNEPIAHMARVTVSASIAAPASVPATVPGGLPHRRHGGLRLRMATKDRVRECAIPHGPSATALGTGPDVAPGHTPTRCVSVSPAPVTDHRSPRQCGTFPGPPISTALGCVPTVLADGRGSQTRALSPTPRPCFGRG
jgi:hypothetical protein